MGPPPTHSVFWRQKVLLGIDQLAHTVILRGATHLEP